MEEGYDHLVNKEGSVSGEDPMLRQVRLEHNQQMMEKEAKDLKEKERKEKEELRNTYYERMAKRAFLTVFEFAFNCFLIWFGIECMSGSKEIQDSIREFVENKMGLEDTIIGNIFIFIAYVVLLLGMIGTFFGINGVVSMPYNYLVKRGLISTGGGSSSDSNSEYPNLEQVLHYRSGLMNTMHAGDGAKEFAQTAWVDGMLARSHKDDRVQESLSWLNGKAGGMGNKEAYEFMKKM